MALLDPVANLLQSTAVGNLFLLLAAIIGVGGNFILYYRRRKHKRANLRLALLSELLSMQPTIQELDHQTPVDEMDTQYPEYFLSNNVYDNNTEALGILTESEVIAVVEFYTQAAKVQAVGSSDPGNVFTEAAERQLYEKLSKAINEVTAHVESSEFDDRIASMEDPAIGIASDEPF